MMTVVRRPLAGDRTGHTGEPAVLRRDVGLRELVVVESVEELAFLVNPRRREDAGMGLDHREPPRGARLLRSDTHEIGRAGRGPGHGLRCSCVESGIPRRSLARQVQRRPADLWWEPGPSPIGLPA